MGRLFLTAAFLSIGATAAAQAPASMRQIGSHPLPVMAVAVSPDGTTVASASGFPNEGLLVGQIRMWDLANGHLLRELTAPRGGVFYSVAFSPDGSRLAAGNFAGEATIWDARKSSLLHALPGHGGPVRALAFSPDGRRLASAGVRSDEVRLWDPTSGEPISTMTAHAGGVMALAWSPSGARLATLGRDRTLKVWRAETGALESTIEGLEHPSLSLAFAADGLSVAIGGAGVTIVDLVRGTTRMLAGHPNTVTALQYSPDGTVLATGTGEPVQTGTSKERVAGLPEFQIAPPTNKGSALTATRAGLVRLFDAPTGALARELSAVSDLVWSVAYSPDGATLVTGNADGTVRAWQLR